MTKILEFENAESIDSNGIHGGTFEIVLMGDFGTLLANVEVEHEFDDSEIYTNASVVNLRQLDQNDNSAELTFTEKEVESFIESDLAIDEFFEDRIEGLAE